MSPRVRRWSLAAITVLLLGGAIVYGAVAFADYQARASAPSQVSAATATHSALPAGPRLVFRNTASGTGYGLVASVPLDDPSGERTISGPACDRVYATRQVETCLHTDRGVVTTFTETLYDADGTELKSWPLPGVPSRTRISADSKLIAQTSFVTGEAYGTVAFSTQTTISRVGGTDYGSLEDFTFLVDGQKVTSPDRNFWGVTFADDGNTFYATGATAHHTYLVRGNLRGRTLVAIKDGAECPSLSPDGGRVAYKKNLTPGAATPHWTLAVLDFASGVETRLPIEQSVDDQALWLDDGTLLYGLASKTDPGDSDVYAVPADGSAGPTLFLRHAWSPSVVR